ncbi:MAG: argininosuccinate synthase [Planctomycetes bacterium]|nr:argininosuccinate synthase [Planctomycetota bacterium]
MARPKVVLAFSGGLDTSFCLVHLREEKGMDVFTATVDTGGFTAVELAAIEKKALDLGAVKHQTLDGRALVYDEYVTTLIHGNVLRGGVYPLSVAAERAIQARLVVDLARQLHVTAIAHGCTVAGNDQFRFDVAFSVLAPELVVLAPVRDLGVSRKDEYDFLRKHGFPQEIRTRDYSINEGLWGTTIGGGETHDPWAGPPEAVLASDPEEIVIGFEEGLPVSLAGQKLSGLEIVRRLNERALHHSVGRGVHLGDTILGIKGRIFFEAPAPLILVQAHRELEKLVLTKTQQELKSPLGETYGRLLHEGLAFEPALEDIRAFLRSTQSRVTGEARVRLYRGSIWVVGVRSPYSLMNLEGVRYGETNTLLDGKEARGFGKVQALPSLLWRLAGKRAAAAPASATTHAKAKTPKSRRKTSRH